MSFELDLQSRRAALQVTPKVGTVMRSLRDAAATRIRPALEGYFEIWRSLPRFDAIVKQFGAEIIRTQSAYFAKLFDTDMDAAYLERLKELHKLSQETGLGVRLHLGGSAHVALTMFEEIGRRHRFSGRRTAEDCAAVLRTVVVDCLNAFHLEQEHLKEAIDERQARIDGAMSAFSQAAGHLRTAMGEAASTLSDASSRTADAVHAALEASERTSEAADQGSSNLVSTAAASAQLVGSIDEVDRLANQSLDAVRDTTTSVGSLRSEIGELERAATEIGSVVTMIAGIASQTNLLALNATIEAARAGEAGRGFSVVAAEVKALAGQTADATRDITAQVAAIQDAAARSAEQLGRIVSVIGRVEGISSAAAAATSQQASATAAIADQARHASDAVTTIQAAADGVRAMMHSLQASLGGMDQASRRLSEHGERFETELARLSSKLTAA